jgi:hypothetical protein
MKEAICRDSEFSPNPVFATSSAILENSFEATLLDFKKRLTPKEQNDFQFTTLDGVKREIARIQKEQDDLKTMMNMPRIQSFLEGMNELGKVIEVFLNASNFVAFVWGPVKFLLQVCHRSCLPDCFVLYLLSLVPSLSYGHYAPPQTYPVFFFTAPILACIYLYRIFQFSGCTCWTDHFSFCRWQAPGLILSTFCWMLMSRLEKKSHFWSNIKLFSKTTHTW